MASIEEIKDRVDLPDLAASLGMKQGAGQKANWFSPAREEKNPSLSITQKGGRWSWKDWAGDDSAAGSCIDLVIYCGRANDVSEALKFLHEYLGIPTESPLRDEPRRERTLAESIGEDCLRQAEQAKDYLMSRRISVELINEAIARKSIGFNTYTSKKVEAGQAGHGGPAVAFIVRELTTPRIVAVDLRYLDPALNGGVKTQCQGDKQLHGWTLCPRKLAEARTVILTESSINALSVECARLPKTAAYAVLGTKNIKHKDWRWLRGRQVLIAFDHTDAVDEKSGNRPGLSAAWEMHEILTRLDISAMLIDMSGWGEGCDLNDYLKEHGPEKLAGALRRIEPWLFQGMAGFDKKDDRPEGRQRVYLPWHDASVYWRYRVQKDFTTYITELKTDDQGAVSMDSKEVCSFRVAGLSRVTIQGTVATTTGEEDSQPSVAFAAVVQAARHGDKLMRQVVEDEKLFNIDTWKKFGAVWDQSRFMRMLNILERGAGIGERKAANFVGLCFMDGRLTVSEGSDTYFTNPKQQCPYSNLSFPTGRASDARKVIEAYQATFRDNAASILLAWTMGAHMKVLLGFWPHMQLQASKGSGKSVLTGRLEQTTAIKVFSKEAIKTAFRLVITTSATSHPVGWEEISANQQVVIDAAVSLLQEAYNFKSSPRGTDALEYLTCAPVLLIGEDVPVRSLTGKLVRADLTGKKGPMMPMDLPRFPVRQWLEFLASQDRHAVHRKYEELRKHCLAKSRASGTDDGAQRMAANYACILLAWRYLCEFAGIEAYDQGGFPQDVLAEMNRHIGETSADREPWVWIMETLLSEISSHSFEHPYVWDVVKDAAGEEALCLLLRPSHVMDHIKTTTRLRDIWNGLPVKSDRVFKQQLRHSGVIVADDIERMIGPDGNRQRMGHLTAISLERLKAFGLHAVQRGGERGDALLYDGVAPAARGMAAAA
ncbi:toprim domain-containing protein [Uliginosibacterium paludis]|uniref:Toprim domain-containing protein n=1 Tax=Uliginosibacterium paludis TaxID=1615952 RepID=A0ABV2CUJ9_9RHOO